MSDSFKNSMPHLLKEWLTWYDDYNDITPLPSNIDNLVLRTKESLDRHQKWTVTFFNKAREILDND